MEKLSVITSTEKIASRGCPMCGSSIDYSASIPRCPVHGTAPFEVGAGMQKVSSSASGALWRLRKYPSSRR